MIYPRGLSSQIAPFWRCNSSSILRRSCRELDPLGKGYTMIDTVSSRLVATAEHVKTRDYRPTRQDVGNGNAEKPMIRTRDPGR